MFAVALSCRSLGPITYTLNIAVIIRSEMMTGGPFRTRTIRGGNSVKYVEVHLPSQLGLL